MLTEPQIQRYARQILLREVGGRGQQALLSHPLEVRGAGPALWVAVTYLAAGGTPLRLPPDFAAGGFLEGTPLAQFNPDAVAASSQGCLAAAPATPSGPAPWILLGATGVLFRSAAGCEACFHQTAAALGAHPRAGDGAPATAVTLGALAALVAQRLVLGRSEALGGLAWDGERLVALALDRCAAHCGSGPPP